MIKAAITINKTKLQLNRGQGVLDLSLGGSSGENIEAASEAGMGQSYHMSRSSAPAPGQAFERAKACTKHAHQSSTPRVALVSVAPRTANSLLVPTVVGTRCVKHRCPSRLLA